MKTFGSVETAQYLTVIAAFPEDPNSSLSVLDSQLTDTVTPKLEDLPPSSDLCRHQAHIWYTYIHANKIPMHINNGNKNNGRLFYFFIFCFRTCLAIYLWPHQQSQKTHSLSWTRP